MSFDQMPEPVTDTFRKVLGAKESNPMTLEDMARTIAKYRNEYEEGEMEEKILYAIQEEKAALLDRLDKRMSEKFPLDGYGIFKGGAKAYYAEAFYIEWKAFIKEELNQRIEKER